MTDERTRRLRELPRYSQSSLDDMLMRDPDGDWVRFSDVEAVLDTEGDRPEPVIGAVLLARVFAIVNETDPVLASELFRAVMKPVQP
jgi:hypothetical protein